MKEEIIDWLKRECNIKQGVALYAKYGKCIVFKMLLTIRPESVIMRLKFLLCQLANIDSSTFLAVPNKDKFREMFPFLSDINCPNELKVLASDKITTYWNVVSFHEKLFSCHTNIECLLIVKQLVENFIEDRSIKYELDYYKHHGGVLGKHRIFDEQKRVSNIRKMNIRELISKEKQLKDNIWRIKSELAKGDKIYLQSERERRLEAKKRELEIVQKMLDE